MTDSMFSSNAAERSRANISTARTLATTPALLRANGRQYLAPPAAAMNR
jgi:hypothetical protein